MEEWTCRKCGASKPITKFTKHTRSPTGFIQPCRACTSASAKTWAHSHPHSIKATKRKYLSNERNRAKHNAGTQKWHANNPKKVAASLQKYARNNKAKIAAKIAKRQARIRNAPIRETVSLDVLWKRDKGTCQLCFTKIRRKTERSMDHIIPVSEGGEHSYRNTVLAHRSCNSRKGNRHNIAQQQRLFS
jgi:hypothetical protein